MKSSRFIKLRSTAQSPADLVMEQNHNPLRRKVPVNEPSYALTKTFLQDFKVPINLVKAAKEPYVSRL
jgi:proteasome activator subunit 4